MTVTTHNIDQNTDEWLALRKDKVTGSIADILLTWGKKEAMKVNDTENKRLSYYTQRGHLLEDEAIELYESIHRCIVERPGFVTNSKYPDCGASPDGIDDIFLLEVKCLAEKTHNPIKSVKTIPMKIMSQLQFNMMITELKVAKLIMYNPDLDDPKEAYREIVVHTNKAIQTNIKRKLTNDLKAKKGLKI